jgi:hypothetical protein
LEHVKKAEVLLLIPIFNLCARDNVFLGLLWESPVDFVACDNRHANKTTLSLLASIVAEESHHKVSARAKAALAKRKRRKEPVGTPTNLTDEGRRHGADATREAHQFSLTDDLEARLKMLRVEGKSLREIATIFTTEQGGIRAGTRRCHTPVRRLFLRMDRLDQARVARHSAWVAAGSPRGPRPRRRPITDDSS